MRRKGDFGIKEILIIVMVLLFIGIGLYIVLKLAGGTEGWAEGFSEQIMSILPGID